MCNNFKIVALYQELSLHGKLVYQSKFKVIGIDRSSPFYFVQRGSDEMAPYLYVLDTILGWGRISTRRDLDTGYVSSF